MSHCNNAVAHHQAGWLQEAEQFYCFILQAQPYQLYVYHNQLRVPAGQVVQHVARMPYLTRWLSIHHKGNIRWRMLMRYWRLAR